MKTTLIFPPQWTPLSPHCAPQTLAAQLNANGFETHILDLNIGFYEEILRVEYVKKQLDRIIEIKKNLTEKVKMQYEQDKDPNSYSDDFKLAAKHLLKIQFLENEQPANLLRTIEFLPHALNIMRSPEMFYQLNLLETALFSLDTCLNIISLAFFPWELTLHDYMSPQFKFKFENILKETHSENIFTDYFYKELPGIIEADTGLIGISIGSSSQFIAGLTLAKIIKMNTDIPVVIAGNYISRILDAIEKTPKFFDEYCDYVIFEEGELSIVELARYLEGKKSSKNPDKRLNISDVSRLLFKHKNGKVIKNKTTPTVPLNKTATQSLEGLDLKKYFLPEIVLPIQASRGCYWRKCTFCDHDFGQGYNVKDISKLVDEIKELGEKYGIYKFEFVDEAINANYLKNFSKRLIEEGLKIDWYCNCRLEDELTEDIFKLARSAGLRMILWGYESGSEKIMELINKGVDVEKRLEILKRSNDADIWNFAYIFFGFPTETVEDAQKTIKAVCENIDIIPAYGRSVFSLGKHALMREEPEKFGVKKLSTDDEPFSSNCSYELISGLEGQQLNELMSQFTQDAIKIYQYPSWMTIRYRESLFLYICKTSMQKVKELKSVV